MLKEMTIGNWKLRIGEDREVPENVLSELENFLSKQWREAAMEDVREIGNSWWAVEKLLIPSPIVRIDIAPTLDSNNPQKFIYEVEVRPAGLGTTLKLLPNKMKSQWKEVLTGCYCQGFVSLDTPIQDDALAAEVLDMSYFEKIPSEKGPFWIRTKIDDHRAPDLEKISLVPIQMDGYKGYLLKLGLGFPLKDPSSLPWERGFVLKPIQGARMKGVKIWLPQKRDGTSTRTKIWQTVIEEKGSPYLWQPFISPKAEECEGKKGWFIWRVFFGWFDWQQGYRFIGGLWNWRPNLRVHGASDAVMGGLFKKR
ncbi:MAG: hypothetical protein QME57_03935 [Patescibacteria group bacterium]|nr:hypothetical protein [Patescibacteria group bacterium]